MNKEIKRDENERKKMFTIFILFFPSILIGLVPENINGSIWVGISLKALLVFYQFVVLKNFIDAHYD
jgi:hypothetical protein